MAAVKTLYCIQYFFFFCEESLVRDTNLHYKDCSEMHSGSYGQMTSSCKCPIRQPDLVAFFGNCRGAVRPPMYRRESRVLYELILVTFHWFRILKSRPFT